MLVSEGRAESGDGLDYHVVGRGDRRGGGGVIGCQPGIRAVADITADPVAEAELPLQIVLRPFEPAWLDVAGETTAVSEEFFVHKSAVIKFEIAGD